MTAQSRPLPDAPAREAILTELGTNMVVEAAAGTGKTTCLVGRLMNLFRRGALNGDARLAAVTFTHKAASELRERLDRELARAIAEGEPCEERDNLVRAQANLADCHIGTIHSFCARLLRERPVEAGIGPDFRELEQDDDMLLRRRAWTEFSGLLQSGGHRDLYGIFEIFGMDLDALGAGFEKFADYPDIDDWPGGDRAMAGIDLNRFVAGVEAFHERLVRFRPALDEAECGRDQLIPILQILDRRFPRLRRPLAMPDAVRLARLFREKPDLVQKHWRQLNLEGHEAKEELAAYTAFWEGAVGPFREQCLAAVYGAAQQAFLAARDIYDRLRREQGVLNFQDLLMASAAMLRDYPEVRSDLSGRYARLLVDEVQDTDPVQAEIMFLLASSDARQRDWRRCPPRPGALFIVGDPKQSIYRFRRADIVVYQEVKRLIAGSGGKILGLSANFRSQPEILDWVNRTFLHPEDRVITPEAAALSGRFTMEESPYSPGYVPLEPGLPPAGPEAFHGVFYLETKAASRKDGVTEGDVVRDEAARIAAFIRDAVDRGLPLASAKGPRPAAPGDFLIVTYQKAAAPVYADALRRLGLECRMSSGGTLAGSAAPALLLGYLQTLANPCDPVRLAATLRGDLFGLSDRELYAWKKAGGGFNFLQPAMEGDSPVGAILARMKEHFRLFQTADPALAAAKAAEDLGLWPWSCLDGDPATDAGVLAAALELLRDGGETATLGALTERLEWLIANHDQDPLPACEMPGDAVRVMNLHKTKGLEAPVVFLASTRTVRGRRADFAVRRDGGRVAGGMAICGGEHGSVVLARPADWEPMAEEEELFQAAEKTRLNYVAATRAGAALVVSVHQSAGSWKSAFLPEFRPGVTIENKLPEPSEPPRPAGERTLDHIDADALRASADLRREQRSLLLGETYRAERAKPDTVRAAPAGRAAEDLPVPALDAGEILHRLLERDAPESEVVETARALLAEYELPAALAGEFAAMALAVRQSSLWRRAQASGRVFREAPFAVRLEEGVLQRGVIDLVFLEDGEWVIADYKSERLPDGSDPAAAAARHREQLSAYVKAWESVTCQRVKEAGIYFLRDGVYVVVDL